ncbi:MAG: YkgJ family cysteine cluster protein, partial [Pseudomonadota bacterium]
VYDCTQCPGYCCSYPVIELTKKDVERIAKYFEMDVDKATRKFTRADHGYDRIMRRKEDDIYGRICQFFDAEARNCSIYKARPKTCRTFPGPDRCGYYDFLSFERETQEDPDHVALTNSSEFE